MAAKQMLLWCFPFTHVLSFIHQKPVAEKIWSQNCERNSYVLNDCNWCHCNKRLEYTCKARLCSQVDMFGHFNDAISEINVGMEGHGVWRSTETPCEPKVHYRRDALLCVCGEDGTWPNPVCRDIFQNLHPIDLVPDTKIKQQKCNPSKLYLIRCNICFCPSDGNVDPNLCTKNICNDNDPVINKEDDVEETAVEEVYAECNSNTKYKLGCQTCVCLRNNRLLCDNCTKDIEDSYCRSKKYGEYFNIDCNTCKCNSEGQMRCTVKHCLNGSYREKLKKRLTIPDIEYTVIERPTDDQNCEAGTKYRNKCNECYCFIKDGIKMFACTLSSCSPYNDIQNTCVEDTVYEINCLICHCVVHGEYMMQVCQVNKQCIDQSTKVRTRDLRSLHGYCEPLHVYRKDCNTCTCQADGQSLQCTTKLCRHSPRNPLSVDIVPVIEKIGTCPVGHYYRIDCNICFCLSNGNAICTTSNCKEE